MKIGDVVRYNTALTLDITGVIVGFNKKGEGGHDYVHILRENGKIEVRLSHILEVIKSKDQKNNKK